MPKTEEVMRLLNISSEDDLPETLQSLGHNKKKSDDIHVLLGAIDELASSLASAVNEDTKLQLSTHIIDKFQNFMWAATGNDISDSIMPFNITFISEMATRALATKVDSLSMVEAGGSAMSYTDAQAFLKNDACFLPDTSSCAHCLAVHSILVDIMMGPTNPFAVAYCNCIRELQSHLLLGLRLHYSCTEEWACYHMALRILYWLTQQILYFLSQRKLSMDLLLPDFDGLL